MERPVEYAMGRLGLRSWYRVWPTIVVLLGAALVLAQGRVLPRQPGSVPSAWLLGVTGVLLGGVSALLLATGVRRLGLPARSAVAAGAGIACVAVVKFTFGPLGFYDAARERTFTVPVEGFVFLAIASGGLATLLLYVAALRLLFASFVRRAGGPDVRRTVSTIVSGAILIAGLAIVAVFVVAIPGFYLRLVLTSVAAGMVAAALLFAIASFAVAFSSSADAARAAGDVGMYTSVFGLCLAFLVVFHVLWIVYMLVLTAVWPLKTVTPK
jgi:hypothetical protein